MPADLFRVGDRVEVDCNDGFGGPATVIEVRDSNNCRCKVKMDNPVVHPPFWAHDFELSPRTDEAIEPYDSRPHTLVHIGEVRRRVEEVRNKLAGRQAVHDLSKLADPEKSVFDAMTPRLKASTYGSDEYKGFLAEMKTALDHHYAHNSHHPEHYPDGIRGMCLIDVIEMLADWKAATMRHADGDLSKSIEINQKRFGYGDELKAILVNTASRLGWL